MEKYRSGPRRFKSDCNGLTDVPTLHSNINVYDVAKVIMGLGNGL